MTTRMYKLPNRRVFVSNLKNGDIGVTFRKLQGGKPVEHRFRLSPEAAGATAAGIMQALHDTNQLNTMNPVYSGIVTKRPVEVFKEGDSCACSTPRRDDL